MAAKDIGTRLPKGILTEVCCGSAEDVVEAFRAGADRAELCSDLFHGGLTPSIGSLLVAKERTTIPVMAMVRPREGGFCYSETEFSVCMSDAHMLLQHGADGLVFGFLHADGTIDAEKTRAVASLALEQGREAVFHRAFDVVPDWHAAMDLLAELGITRILTSGQAPDVSWGIETVGEMVRYADGRIQVMPGAGITRGNIAEIVRRTGAEQVHVAAYRQRADHSADNNRSIYYGGCLYPPEDRHNLADAELIAGMIRELK